jgi:hypothetical protein
VNVAFPLAFVTGRLRALPWIALAALLVQILFAWIGVELFELDGIAASLALSTLLVLAAVLAQLRAASAGLRGIAIAAAVVAGLTCAAFLPPALVTRGALGALAGLGIYGLLVALVRPRGLASSWSYLRALR